MDVQLWIQNGTTVYEPVTEGGISWDTQRKGQPGKCTFHLIPDSKLVIEEGNAIRLDVDGTPVFFGFIFERSWNSDGKMKVTAYDQLRYLKNKQTYGYENKTAGEVVQMIADDFRLRTGELEDTGHKIETRIERDATLFDIILNAMDITMLATGKIYVLYDDAGKLTLRNVENMKLNLSIESGTAQDYDYTVSIDKDTYNQIRLFQDQENQGERAEFEAADEETKNKWGILQLSETLDKGMEGQRVADTYLFLHNRPSKSLSVKGAFGDIRVRAGCLLPVRLDIREMQLQNYLLAEAVSHTIDGGIHTMDLTLRGAGISGS